MKTGNMHLTKWISTGLCLTLMTGLVACGGETAETADENEVVETTADADVADTWDNDRFNTTFASNNRYGDWDANDDNLLDDNEFDNGFFSSWDTNDDNILDENEWNTASKDYGFDGQNWADWDTNNDKQLDENEFKTGFAKNDYYNTWDKDGDKMIGEREYSDGLFGLWDDNDDGILDDNEYNTRYNRYYGTM